MGISGIGGVQDITASDRLTSQPGTISHLIRKAGELPAPPPPVKAKPVEKPVEKAVEKPAVERPVEHPPGKVQVDRQIATTRAVAAAYEAAPQPTAVFDALA